ncbi:MAG: site-specific integrase [Clostridiales bacterium]|nr:site-specific integrase [Clostridiales bacterium]
MLQKAVRWQILSDNPARRIDTPSVKKTEVPHYELDTALLMLDYLDKEPIKHRAIIYVALYSQMREGEIMGLNWNNLNECKQTLSVKRASQYIPGQGTFEKNPKNDSSIRTEDIPKEVVDILLQWKEEQKKEKKAAGTMWQKSSRIFTTWDGKPMHPYTPSKWFHKFVIKYGLPPLTLHGLRHTGITLLLDSGADIDSVSRRAGHSQRSTTMNIYSHKTRNKDRVNSDTLSSILQRNNEQKVVNQSIAEPINIKEIRDAKTVEGEKTSQ